MNEPTPGHTPGPVPGDATDTDIAWLRSAIELSFRCPRSTTAFSVGAIVLGAGGEVLADGYSRRDDPHDHAEEAALRSVDPDDPRLRAATLYSSLEPCTGRATRPRSCTELILDTPIPRVVFAWREPAVFVDCEGVKRLRAAGRMVVEVSSLAPLVRGANAHLL